MDNLLRWLGVWDKAYRFSSLSQKTRKSNDLKMTGLPTQSFKTLSVDPAGVGWANQAGVSFKWREYLREISKFSSLLAV